MKVEPKATCPLNNFEKCKELDCGWFIKIAGKHPQSEEMLEEWGCTIAWMPLLLVENSQQQRQTGAAVESFRNEMVRANETSQQLMLAATQAANPNLKVLEVNK